MILLDANVALRLAAPTHVQHAVAKAALSVLLGRGEMFAIVAQTIYEFWSVATRPVAVNGLGLSIATCQTEFARLRTYALFLPTSQPCSRNGSPWSLRINAWGRRPTMPGLLPRCARMA